ncbi:MAG: hypothetical protein KJO11_08025 [Gemmatimonadetes bacterium]|nr:hypothetical protein [Gemmatimonadota bacterium]MBT8405426.1 hypothetical protein [Gemmatimonadota bacterium]NNK64022.1 hypothetical protein [Gemmatimonadota bacterium]
MVALVLTIPAGAEAQARPSRGPAATPRTPAVQGYALPYSRDEGRRGGIDRYDEGRRGNSDRYDRGRRQGAVRGRAGAVRWEAGLHDVGFYDARRFDARLYDPRRDRWVRVRFDRDPLRYRRGLLDDRDLRRVLGRSTLEALAFEARVGTRALHGRVEQYGPRGRWVTVEVWAGRRLVAALTDFDRDRRVDDIILSPRRLR